MVRKLAFLGCSYYEMGRILGADESVIRRRFAAEKEQAESRGNMRLRRAQLKRALKGSDTMLIHLGKQRLGQTDRVDLTTKGEQVGVTVIELPIKELHGEDPTECRTTNGVYSEPG